jgi:hypothetical protein
VKFSATVFQSPLVCAVNNPDESICALKIVPPKGPQRLLPPDVPEIKLVSKGKLCIRGIYLLFDLTDPLCSKVLILNPKVGEIVLTSSPLNLFRIVVFPALSRPLFNLC